MNRHAIRIAAILAILLALAACQKPAHEPASATPDAADVKADEAQPAASQSIAGAASASQPSATDMPLADTADAPMPTVDATGFGPLHFGITRGEAEKALGGAFRAPAQPGCQQVHSTDQPEVLYLFNGGKLQRIDVSGPRVMAEGGGHVGMQADDIRTLYAGRLSEQPDNAVKGGLDLKVAGSNGNGIVFQADASGNITAFHAGVAQTLDAPEGCP